MLPFGEYEEITNPEQRSKTFAKLLNRFPMLTPVEPAITEEAGPPRVIVCPIRINKNNGSCGVAENQPFKTWANAFSNFSAV